MATELGLAVQIAKRDASAEIVVPSVVHWKLGHFGAIVRAADGRYLVKDPTFGNETWLSVEAIEQEASAYFLVPSAQLPATGWRKATEA